MAEKNLICRQLIEENLLPNCRPHSTYYMIKSEFDMCVLYTLSTGSKRFDTSILLPSPPLPGTFNLLLFRFIYYKDQNL